MTRSAWRKPHLHEAGTTGHVALVVISIRCCSPPCHHVLALRKVKAGEAIYKHWTSSLLISLSKIFEPTVHTILQLPASREIGTTYAVGGRAASVRRQFPHSRCRITQGDHALTLECTAGGRRLSTICLDGVHRLPCLAALKACGGDSGCNTALGTVCISESNLRKCSRTARIRTRGLLRQCP